MCRYGRLLLRQLADDQRLLPQLLSVAPGQSEKGEGGGRARWTVQEAEARWTLYEGKPGRRAGHIVDASSYFDRRATLPLQYIFEGLIFEFMCRLWKRGSLDERYFIVLEKSGDGAASDPSAGKGKRLRSEDSHQPRPGNSQKKKKLNYNSSSNNHKFNHDKRDKVKSKGVSNHMRNS